MAFLADCSFCAWERLTEREDTSESMQILHLAARHPDEFTKLRNKDPEQFLREFDELYQHFKRSL